MNLEDKSVLVILFVEVGGFGWYGIIMSIVSVVGIIVGIVVNNVAELYLGDGVFTGEMLPKFRQNISEFI